MEGQSRHTSTHCKSKAFMMVAMHQYKAVSIIHHALKCSMHFPELVNACRKVSAALSASSARIGLMDP